MKEGEDPKDPNDGGVISIHHGEDASDEESIADESADTTSGDDDAVGNFDDNDTEPKDIFDTSDSIEQSDEAAVPQTPEDAAPSSAAPKKSNYAQRRSGGMRNISDTEAATPAPTAHTPQFFNDAMVANTPVEAPRKSKKGPVIVIAITLTVILLVVLAVVLLAKNGGIGGNPNGGGTEYVRPVASNDLRGSFNVYASYFGFGKSSTEKPDMKKARNQKNTYYALSVINGTSDEENPKEYLQELNRKYNAFVEIYEKEFNIKPTGYLEAFFYVLQMTEMPSYEDLFQMYKKKGAEGAKNEIDKIFEKAKDNNVLNSYITRTIKYYGNYIDLFEVASKKGCLNSSKSHLNADCLSKNKNALIYSKEAQTNSSKLRIEYDGLRESAIKELGEIYDNIYPSERTENNG